MLIRLLIINILAFPCYAKSQEQIALEKTLEGIYYYNGIDKMVNNKVKFYRERIPKEFQPFGIIIDPLITFATQQKVVIKYEF